MQARLEADAEKLWSLHEMERTGGEPDVVGQDKKSGEYVFYDCSAQSPKGRTSLCYDREALDSRKEFKPKNSVVDMAAAMGIELLTEEQYFELQKLGEFDTKTSSWIATPADIRKLGGALYCDRRYGRVFVGHNGAQSYYGGRAFRGSLRVQVRAARATVSRDHSEIYENNSRLRLQQPRKIGAVTPEQKQREGGDDEGQRQSLMIHEDVETEDVHNHRAEQRETERNVAANQENQSAENLATGNDVEIVRGIHRSDEVAGRP